MAEVKLITGKINSGKSTYAAAYISEKRKTGIDAAGFLSDAEYCDGRKDRYFLKNISTGQSLPAVSAVRESEDMKAYGFSRFFFSESAYSSACQVLLESMSSPIILIDEIGPLELNGYGFSPALKILLKSYSGELLLVVREDAVGKMLSYFDIADGEYLILRD